MTHHDSSQRARYLRTLNTEYFEPARIRRATRIPSTAAIAAVNAFGTHPGDDWLSIFETELEDALAEFEELRTEGGSTAEISEYVAFLNACVAELYTDPQAASARVDAPEALDALATMASRRQAVRR